MDLLFFDGDKFSGLAFPLSSLAVSSILISVQSRRVRVVRHKTFTVLGSWFQETSQILVYLWNVGSQRGFPEQNWYVHVELLLAVVIYFCQDRCGYGTSSRQMRKNTLYDCKAKNTRENTLCVCKAKNPHVFGVTILLSSKLLLR